MWVSTLRRAATVKTRQENDSTESKVTRVAFHNYKKSACRFWVISLFSLCVDPSTTCLSPHEATPFAGRKPVESSAVGTAGQKSLPPCFFLGHETFAHGAVGHAMRYEKRNENTSQKEEDKLGMHHPRWDRRVIRSLGDDESVDPNERMVAV